MNPAPKTRHIANPAVRGWRTSLAPLVGLLLPPALCHFGFSWIGFNPTDDGWLQAVARRLAEGEVPHRDFIFVRPALSALLQVPLVWWGGDYVIWLSRLWGWLTLGAVCWIWSGRAAGDVGAPIRFSLYVGALLLCAHTFPVMAWHSIDGMLFATLAVWLLQRATPARRRLAFFAAGLAVLCRQNFVVFAPLLLLGAGGKPSRWFAAGFWSMLPSLLYLAVMGATGAAADFWHQVASVRGAFLQVAVQPYITHLQFPVGVALGILCGMACARWAAKPFSRALPPALFLVAGTSLALALWRDPDTYHRASFGLFGLTLGLTGIALWRRVPDHDRLSLIAGLGLVWSTAISIGYNSPALSSGILLLLLWRLLRILRPRLGTERDFMLGTLLVVLPAIGVGLSHARQTFPYRDRAALHLSYDAGAALDGAAGMRTNALTFACMEDLQQTMHRFESEHRRYAVLTDCSAVWIRSPSRNPLPCEWPQETELGFNQELFRRVFVALQGMPEGSRIIMQKFLISEFSWTRMAVPNVSYYFVQNWVRGHCTKIEETPFFEIYSSPQIEAGNDAKQSGQP